MLTYTFVCLFVCLWVRHQVWFLNTLISAYQARVNVGIYTLHGNIHFILLSTTDKRQSCPCALTEHRAMKAYWGNRGIVPRILDLGTRWRWVVSFTPRPLYSQGKSLWHSLDRRLGGPQIRSGQGGEEKSSQSLPGIESLIIQSVAQRYTSAEWHRKWRRWWPAERLWYPPCTWGFDSFKGKKRERREKNSNWTRLVSNTRPSVP
jgi:hypothetical protein